MSSQHFYTNQVVNTSTQSQQWSRSLEIIAVRPQQWQDKITCSTASTPHLSAPILQCISLLSSTRSSHQRSRNNAKIFKINITAMWFDKGHVSTSVNQQASHAMVTNSCSKRSYKSKGENITIPYTCIQTQCYNTVITGLFNTLNISSITHTTCSSSSQQPHQSYIWTYFRTSPENSTHRN